MTTDHDLSETDLDEMIGDGTQTHLPFVRAALEIRRRRAEASDEERVRSVVREAAIRFAAGVIDESLADAIATRAARQLASKR